MKKMSVKEFRELGLVQEMNRLFLHPMGLALEVVQEDDGTEHFGEVWDRRDDPEGIFFSDGVLSEAKRVSVAKMGFEKSNARIARLGYVIQPVPPDAP